MNRIGKARRMHVAFRLRPMGKRLPAYDRGFAGTATRRRSLVVGQVDLDGIDLQFTTG